MNHSICLAGKPILISNEQLVTRKNKEGKARKKLIGTDTQNLSKLSRYINFTLVNCN